MATPSSEELFGSPRAGGATASAPNQPEGGTVAATQWGHSLIDTRAYGKLKSFSGKEEDWATWSFVARSYLDLLSMGYRDLLTHAEAAVQASEIKLDDMSATARTHAWTLFNVLTQSVEGRALSVLMNAEPSNGLQGWRMLVDSYEPRVGGRYTAMLMGILSPQWGHLKEADFLEALETWETQIRRYEDQSKEKVTSATKCAVTMKNAPGGIRTALRTSSSIIGSDYELLKKAIKDYLQTGVEFDGRGLAAEASRQTDPNGPAPMEVGALSWKGGKKGKDEKGKNKKGGKYSKTKEGKTPKGKNKSFCHKFQGACSYCGKWGHKKSECRIREKEKKGKGSSTNAVDKEDEKSTNAVSYNSLDSWESNKWPRWSYEEETEGRSSSSRSREVVTTSWRGPQDKETWADVQEDAEDDEEHEETEDRTEVKEEEADYGCDKTWIGAISLVNSSVEKSKTSSAIHDQFIMYDSGSDEHVCKAEFGGRGEERKSTIKLSAVSGQALNM